MSHYPSRRTALWYSTSQNVITVERKEMCFLVSQLFRALTAAKTIPRRPFHWYWEWKTSGTPLTTHVLKRHCWDNETVSLRTKTDCKEHNRVSRFEGHFYQTDDHRTPRKGWIKQGLILRLLSPRIEEQVEFVRCSKAHAEDIKVGAASDLRKDH